MSDVFGIHAVRAVLAEAPERVRAVYVQRGRDARKQDVVELARNAGVRVEFADRRWLDRRVSGSHQGVVADCHELAPSDERALEAAWEGLETPRLILVLDGVQDPRNLGACLRSARAAGTQAVLLPRRRSAPLSSTAVKAAAGAAEGLLIVEVANLARRLAWLKERGAWLIGAAGEAPLPYFSASYTDDTVVVIGGEGKGLRRLTREACDILVGIPMAGGVESLNVSVAAGVLLFEAVRQRSEAARSQA
jgi:23S rRNA (guanosine2251-2'-O)-methyltransferase